jgi:membrane peptidoglycan carboxypeptidase
VGWSPSTRPGGAGWGQPAASRPYPLTVAPPQSPSRGTVHRLWLLVAISAVAGVLLAGMLLPIVGGLGLIARAGANDFENLPSVLKQSPLPQVSRILAADGSVVATFYAEDRVPASLSQVPKVMQTALIAIEDVRFYEHHGVDWKGAIRAALHNSSTGSVSQGGSTLTQQYVKNVLIEAGVTGANADTIARKAQEAKYALALERRLTKAQILEAYLNIAYFGDGAYGIGTAAQHYFGVPTRKLTLVQSAMLAGLVQSPVAYDPALHPKAARARRDVVLAQMLKYRFITQADFDKAVVTPVVLHLHKQGNGCEASRYPYFCDYVLNVIKQSTVFGKTRAARVNVLERGGLTIQTTLDPTTQKAADSAIHKYVLPHERSGVAAAEALVEPGTGKVKAISVSSPYGSNPKLHQNNINYAVDAPLGGGSFRFPMGSTFKLFVLTAALKEGLPLATTIFAPPHIVVRGFTNCAGAPVGIFDLHNAGDSESGRFNLITGTTFSVNTFYAQLEQRVGLCKAVKMAQSLGVKQGDGSPVRDDIPSFVLGETGAGFSALDTAGAYATMAAHGLYCAPMAITRVTNRSGQAMWSPGPDCTQAVDPGLADTVTSILHGVLTQRGATAANVGEPGRPAAAKTGTADQNAASDFAGYVPQLAAAVWVGNPSRPHTSLNFLSIGGRTYPRVFGATIAGPIWRDTFTAALTGVPVIPLPKPDPQYIHGLTVPVPDVAGLSVVDATAALRQAGFETVVSPKQINSDLPAGTVAKTSPSGQAPQGSVITILVSNGHPPVASPSPTRSPSHAPSTSPSATPAPRPTKSHRPR